MSAYHINVTVHVFAAVFWLGGMFFLAGIGAPVLRRIEPPALRAELFRALGRRFRAAGWTALAVLLLTGVINLHFRGVLRSTVFGDRSFWATSYGKWLAWKLAAVALMLVLQAVHDFVLGPRASAAEPGSPAASAYRSRASLLARASALAAIITLIAAVRLARGG